METLTGQEARIQKADSLLKTARLLFESGYYNDCVSRGYYAVYHAIIAILTVKRKIVRGRWDHTVLHRAFLDNLCKGGFTFNKTDSNTFYELMTKRREADYHLVVFTKNPCQSLLEKAEKLVDKINEEIEHA